jgi:geranylgeranyl reductase family protein
VDAFDVLIVGGGPAGSSCAWKLRQAGLRTLVIDKKQFPRDKPCAGWITPQVVQALQLDVEQYQQGRTWQPITGFRCGVMGGGEVQVRYDRAISFGIRRYEFDAYLLGRAGCQQRLDEPVEHIERQGRGWIVNGRYAAPLLVGAGGNFCPVARWLGARRKSPASAVVAQEVEFKAHANSFGNVQADTPALFFCRDLRGYGWCFRKGEYLNVGLGRTEAEGFSTHVAQFREFLCGNGIDCAGGDRPWKGHAYQLYDQAPPLVFDEGVLLIGDAAGLAYCQSGEGIRPAVESGLIAADVILKAHGSYGREILGTYPARLEARFGQPQRHSLLSRLPAAWLQSIAARLLASRWFSRRIVMDQWFLHRGDAALSL